MRERRAHGRDVFVMGKIALADNGFPGPTRVEHQCAVVEPVVRTDLLQLRAE